MAFSSKFSSGGKQNLGIGVTFSPSRDEDNYNQSGVEIVDPYQEESEDPFLNSAGLPVRQHHNKLEVSICFSILQLTDLLGFS